MPSEYVQKIRDKFPGSYDDLTDQELASRVIAKYPEYRDVLADVPNPPTAVTRAYQAVAKPVTAGVSRVADVFTEPLVAGARLAQGESPSQVAKSYTTGAGIEDLNKRSAITDNPLAEMAVPQTPTQAAMLAGTLAFPPLAAATRAVPALSAVARLAAAHPALTRVLSGAAGGEAGNQLEGGTTGAGAAEGAVGGLLGEVLGAGYSAARRAGGKARIAAKDAAAYGSALGEASPPLAGATTVQDLHELATSGQKRLGAAKAVSNRDIAQGLGPSSGAMIELPALGETVEQIQPIKGYASATERASVPKSYTLQEANDRLSEIGAKAFSQDVTERNFNGIDQRRLYGRVRQDITDSLDRLDPTGYSSAAFDRMQQHYERGLAGLEPLQRSNVYRPGRTSADAQFNTPAVTGYFRDPKNLADLRDRFGDENVRQLMDLLTRGGGVLSRDTLASGQGRTLDALMQTYGRGQGGASQVLGSILRTVAPNFGADYAGVAGRRPYDLPPILRRILDAAAQRGVDEARSSLAARR